MDDTTKKLVAGLRQAVQAEFEGHSFYLMASRATADVRGKAVFDTLAQEELGHAAFLQAQYKAILTHGKLEPTAALGKPHLLDGSSPIFSDGLRARLREAHFEMTSLSVGVQLEQQAMQFYQAQAAAAADPMAKRFFLELADWESGHYQALLRQQEALRDDYWAQNEFAPF